jgi:hypothetical protein
MVDPTVAAALTIICEGKDRQELNASVEPWLKLAERFDDPEFTPAHPAPSNVYLKDVNPCAASTGRL